MSRRTLRSGVSEGAGLGWVRAGPGSCKFTMCWMDSPLLCGVHTEVRFRQNNTTSVPKHTHNNFCTRLLTDIAYFLSLFFSWTNTGLQPERRDCASVHCQTCPGCTRGVLPQSLPTSIQDQLSRLDRTRVFGLANLKRLSVVHSRFVTFPQAPDYESTCSSPRPLR